MVKPDTRAVLRDACAARTIVRLHRKSRYGDGPVDGRVEGVSRDLVAIAVVGDGIRPDGIRVLRVADIVSAKVPAPYAGFIASAFRARGARWPKLGHAKLTSWRRLVETVSHPVVAVHCEGRAPDVCYVGKFTRTTAERGVMLNIRADASWDVDDPLDIAWRDVTRIDFGGDYEQALVLVGGRGP
jgi:hypothetical protein